MVAKKTVLVVDDEPDIVDVLRGVLELHGYRVLTAADGNAGLALAEREAPDLLILDMVMPVRSGLNVLEKLRRRPLSGPRIIMISGNEVNRHRLYAEQLGVDDYI